MGVLPSNPAELLFTPPTVRKPSRRVLSAEQVQTILGVLGLREQLIVQLALFSGMRPGEILGLQWKMSAYIGVFNHPFFGVSNEQGEVELKNLPAGTFQIQAWQETYGVRTQSVTVAADETKQITFTFKAP